ncbi:MAG: ATP-binding protein [Gammaproteobacteria bacterium]|nr:MAG: ATP-binding protein [Gammaproteobacteria bacterium]RKZ75832.1 MAG: ATP-binding protein [Gammaproteobacteria bacterium]
MTQIFGHFIEELPKQEEYLTIGFSPSSLSLKKRWKNNGLSADFIADYFKMFFISNQVDDEGMNNSILIDNLWNMVKYIANELLENAMKFQDQTIPITAKIEFSLYSDELIFCITNGLLEEKVKEFHVFINKLLSEETENLYFQMMRKNAKSDSNVSRLGLLSIMYDYSAKLGWKFEELQTTPPVMTVNTMVSIKLKPL